MITETNIKDFFNRVGGSYEEVLQRMPTQAMLLKYLRKFPSDPSYDALKNAQARQSLRDAFLAAHTLKGVACSLGLKQLADAASALTEELRKQTAFPDQAYVTAVDQAYAHVIENLSALAE